MAKLIAENSQLFNELLIGISKGNPRQMCITEPIIVFHIKIVKRASKYYKSSTGDEYIIYGLSKKQLSSSILRHYNRAIFSMINQYMWV